MKSIVDNSSVIKVTKDLVGHLMANRPGLLAADQFVPESPPDEWMRWFAERPDVRAHLVCEISGLKSEYAHGLSLDTQVQIVNAAVAGGAEAGPSFRRALTPEDLVLHGNVPAIWSHIREKFPWEEGSERNRDFAELFLALCLTARILSPLDVRLAVDPGNWQTAIPPDIRAQVDRARLAQERDEPHAPFTTTQEFEIVTTKILATHLEMLDLLAIFDAARKSVEGTPDPKE